MTSIWYEILPVTLEAEQVIARGMRNEREGKRNPAR